MNRLEYKYEASPRRHFFYPADAAIWHYTAVQYARKKLHRRHWYVHRRSVASTVAVTVKCRVAAARMSRSTKNLAKLRGTTFCQRMNTRRQVHSTRRCCSVDAATGGGFGGRGGSSTDRLRTTLRCAEQAGVTLASLRQLRRGSEAIAQVWRRELCSCWAMLFRCYTITGDGEVLRSRACALPIAAETGQIGHLHVDWLL